MGPNYLVCFKYSGDFWHERVVRIGITQEWADGEQYFGDGERRRPLRPEDVQADAAVGIDVRVVDPRGEGHLGRLERVVRGEMDGQEKDSSLVRTLGRSHDGRLPMEQIVADRTGAALGGGIPTQVLQFLQFKSHSSYTWHWTHHTQSYTNSIRYT